MAEITISQFPRVQACAVWLLVLSDKQTKTLFVPFA